MSVLVRNKQIIRKAVMIVKAYSGQDLPRRIPHPVGLVQGAIAERLRTQAVQGCALDASALAGRRWPWEFACRSFF